MRPTSSALTVLVIVALIAGLVPVVLLWPQAVRVPPPPRPHVTSFAVAAVPGIDPLLAAPLLNVERSPLPLPAPETAPPPPPAPVPSLVGVITRARGGGLALVKGQNGDTVTLPIGGAIDGWRLVGLTKSGATFDLGDRHETVVLAFRNKTDAGAAATVAPVPGGAPDGSAGQGSGAHEPQ